MPSEGITIRLKRTTAPLDASDLANYNIVYGEPLYFDNDSGQFLAIGDHDSSTAANAYLVKLVQRQAAPDGKTIDIAANPVFYKILSQNDNTAVAIIKDNGTEIYPLTTLDQVIDTTTGSPVSLSALLDKKVDVDIVVGSSITGRIGMGVDSDGIYVVYDNLTIVTQPVSQIVAAGETVMFSVTVVGAGTISYQWQYKNGNNWVNSPVTGSDSPTLILEATVGRNGLQYRCVITDGTNTVYSNTVTLTVQ